jgi:hypothetical protein
VPEALEAECRVDALFHACGHLARLNLVKLSADGHSDVDLFAVPTVCSCGGNGPKSS